MRYQRIVGTVHHPVLQPGFDFTLKRFREILGRPTGKVDERDTMFAREEYLPESEKYKSYYGVHSELKEIDDRIRNLPQLLSPGSRYYDEFKSGMIQAFFKTIAGLTTKVDGPISDRQDDIDPAKMTKVIKDLAIHLGADEVGIAPLNEMYVYSNSDNRLAIEDLIAEIGLENVLWEEGNYQ